MCLLPEAPVISAAFASNNFSTRIIDYLTNYVPARFPEAGALAMTGVLVMLGLVLLAGAVLTDHRWVRIAATINSAAVALSLVPASAPQAEMVAG